MATPAAPPWTPLLPPPPHIAAAIARAERRREKLERLSNLGMDLAQDLAERAARAPRAPISTLRLQSLFGSVNT